MADVALSGRTYRRMDIASKVGGVALIAAGLEVGPLEPAGTALVVAGIALGTITAFITTHE